MRQTLMTCSLICAVGCSQLPKAESTPTEELAIENVYQSLSAMITWNTAANGSDAFFASASGNLYLESKEGRTIQIPSGASFTFADSTLSPTVSKDGFVNYYTTKSLTTLSVAFDLQMDDQTTWHNELSLPTLMHSLSDTATRSQDLAIHLEFGAIDPAAWTIKGTLSEGTQSTGEGQSGALSVIDHHVVVYWTTEQLATIVGDEATIMISVYQEGVPLTQQSTAGGELRQGLILMRDITFTP